MNTEAQRARNKRKRDKLREKRRMVKGDSILRFRLDGTAHEWKHPCGLMLRSQWVQSAKSVPICNAPWKAGKYASEDSDPWSLIEWSTEWVYMSTHDLSSSAHDAICAFINTGRLYHDQEYDKAVMLVQLNGRTRRYVWRGHTPGLKEVARILCSLQRNL